MSFVKHVSEEYPRTKLTHESCGNSTVLRSDSLSIHSMPSPASMQWRFAVVFPHENGSICPFGVLPFKIVVFWECSKGHALGSRIQPKSLQKKGKPHSASSHSLASNETKHDTKTGRKDRPHVNGSTPHVIHEMRSICPNGV